MSRLIISFLGTFQTTLSRQPITHFRSTNNQGLLVYLSLHSVKPIAREVLTAFFWPDASDQNARNNLRQSLYQLRKLLGDSKEAEQPYLLVTRQTVQFNSESDYLLDVHQFLRGIEEGDLETAVSHYHGELLPGFTCDSVEFEDWLRQERESLHNLALETMFELTRDYLQNGRYDKAQAIARQQIVFEPWREPAYRQLMQAYALAGDRAKALTQFELCQAVLRNELGIDPSQETITLFEDIKTERFASAETVRPPVKIRHNLPASITLLIGRELEHAQLGQLFTQDKQRLVTILGPGGIGKTRLALAVGVELLDQYQDGVYFIDLAPLVQPEEISMAMAVALGYEAPDKAQALFPQLLNTMSRQNLLLILDNFEHLLAGATLVNDILQQCPDVAVLSTSRQRLNLTSESRYELGGFAFPDWLTPDDALNYAAVQLFVENGRRAQLDFILTENNVTDIVHICQLVQGIPLGLLLAASWLEMLTPTEIAVEIEKSLDFLAADLADLPSRQRSMQAVFDYSWQMLPPTEQIVLAQLSVFRGGFTREAAEQVAGANLRILLSLVNKSLLQRQPENGRFTIHELLRQFAASQRQQLDTHSEALFAHCRYFAKLAKVETRQALFFFPLQMPQKYADDRDNFLRAWDYALHDGLAEELSDLAQAIVMFKFNMNQASLRTNIPVHAIKVLRQQGYAETDRVMLHLQLVAQGTRIGIDDLGHIREQLLSLEPLLKKKAYPELLFWLYERLEASYAWENGRFEAAIPWSEKAYETAVKMEDELLVKVADVSRIFNQIQLELHDEITTARLQELRSFFELNFSTSAAFYGVLASLQIISTANGSYEEALVYGKQSLNVAIKWQNLLEISWSYRRLAGIYLQMGLPDQAKLQILAIVEWHLAIGQEWQMLGCLYSEAAGFPELIGGQETAVTILSMISHHSDTAYLNYLIDEALPQFKDELEAEVFAAAWEAGKGMELETAVFQVQSALKLVKADIE